MLLLRKGHNHGGKCCRSSTKPHNHKNGCGGSHDSSSHHHHHHEHDQHQHEDHSHKLCCSNKTKKLSPPQKCGVAHGSSSHHHHHHRQHQHEHHNHDQYDQHHQKCASQTSLSTCPPCSSGSTLGGIVNHCSTVKGHDQCKGSEEFHEHDHCHHGRCAKNQDGVHKHDTENESCSDSHNLILNTEDNHAVATNRHGSCLGHKDHGTKHCHNKNLDMVTHDSALHSSPCHHNVPCKIAGQQFTHNHCHLIHGCENLKDHESNHDIEHEKSGCHSDFEKHGTGEISIDIITEHVESASMHCLKEKEKGSCGEGCSDTCENLPVVCGCESSNDKEDIACCRSEGSSKECKESPIMHVCDSLNKREVGGCCKSYMKECCAKLGHSSRAGFVGGLSEIITE